MPRFEHDGISQYYTVNGYGFPLVFVHGLGLSHQNWIAQTPVFAKNYKVITYDCRGHGGTGVSTGPISFHDLAGDLHALLDHIGVERAVLVGYSSGTLIAQSYAISHPDRVAGLCLIGSTDKVNNLYLKFRTQVSKLMIVNKMHKLLAYSVATTNSKNLIHRGFFYRIAKRVNPEESLRILEAMQHFVEEYDVTKIQCPTLLVHGSRDRSSEDNASVLSHKIPNARVSVVEGVNHAVVTRAASAFNLLLDEWLQELGLPNQENKYLINE
jgi:pimeloyl-ACP methyl ester carboxylesterase